MTRYRVIGLVIAVTAVGLVAGLRLDRAGSPQVAPTESADCDACCLPVPADGQAQAAPAIPTSSGRPCLVEFGSDECAACQEMAKVLVAVEPRLKGKVDIIRVDSDIHLGEVQRWRLRIVPTQIMVDAQGKELWRHEGSLTAEELLTKILPQSTSKSKG